MDADGLDIFLICLFCILCAISGLTLAAGTGWSVCFCRDAYRAWTRKRQADHTSDDDEEAGKAKSATGDAQETDQSSSSPPSSSSSDDSDPEPVYEQVEIAHTYLKAKSG
jgi:hypothetical protein